MHSSELNSYLRCPEDRSVLTPASDDLVRQINAAIDDGRLINRAGRILDEPLSGGFIREAGDVLYPVLHGIPVLLRDEGIPLEQLPTNHHG
jgi:uncharacterized protein YbaR (Trm112 family)